MSDRSDPAFPAPDAGESDYGSNNRGAYRGLTMRDYFAGKAMAIMWAAYDQGYMGLNSRDEPNVDVIAQAAYQMADAMLAARTNN